MSLRCKTVTQHPNVSVSQISHLTCSHRSLVFLPKNIHLLLSSVTHTETEESSLTHSLHKSPHPLYLSPEPVSTTLKMLLPSTYFTPHLHCHHPGPSYSPLSPRMWPAQLLFLAGPPQSHLKMYRLVQETSATKQKQTHRLRERTYGYLEGRNS